MVFLLKDLFKTMNSQAVERMNKNSDKTRSSPLDFSQVIVCKCTFMDIHLFPFCLLLLLQCCNHQKGSPEF